MLASGELRHLLARAVYDGNADAGCAQAIRRTLKELSGRKVFVSGLTPRLFEPERQREESMNRVMALGGVFAVGMAVVGGLSTEVVHAQAPQ